MNCQRLINELSWIYQGIRIINQGGDWTFISIPAMKMDSEKMISSLWGNDFLVGNVNREMETNSFRNENGMSPADRGPGNENQEMKMDSFREWEMKMRKWKQTHSGMKMKWVLPAGDQEMKIRKWKLIHSRNEKWKSGNESGIIKTHFSFREWNGNELSIPTLFLARRAAPDFWPPRCLRFFAGALPPFFGRRAASDFWPPRRVRFLARRSAGR